MNGNSKCQYGENGCVTVQNMKGEIVKIQADTDHNSNDIKALWKNHDSMRGLIIKMFLVFAGIAAGIQVVIKLIPIGN